MKKIATTWSRPAPLGQPPRPRCSHASCVTDGKLIICGGWSSGNRFLDDVHIYSIETNTWTQPKMKGESRVRVGHSMTSGDKNNEIWVIGGTMGASSVLDVQVLELSPSTPALSSSSPTDYTGTWSTPNLQGSPPEARSRHSANRFGQYIYIFGGGDNQRLFRDVWQLDTKERTWSLMSTQGEAPSGRWGHTATFVDTRLFIFGGHDGVNRLNDVHILDVEKMTWFTPDCHAKLPASSPRSSLVSSSSSLNNASDEFAHSSSNSFSASPRSSGDDWTVTDPPADLDSPPSSSSSSRTSTPSSPITRRTASSSSSVPSISSASTAQKPGATPQTPAEMEVGIPPARAGHSANCLGRKLIVYGGGDGKLLGDMYYLHVDTYEWSAMESGNVPDRCAHTSEVVYTPGGSRLLVFGGSNGIKTFNDLYMVACSKNRMRVPSGKRKSNSLLRNASPASPSEASSSSPTSSASPSNHANGLITETQKLPPLPIASVNAKSASATTSSGSSSSPRAVAAAPPHTSNSPRSPRSNPPSMSYKDALQHTKEPQKAMPPKTQLKRAGSGTIVTSAPYTSAAPSSSHFASIQQDSDKLRAALKEAGLEKFLPTFLEQEITFSQLSSLTEAHYKALGMTSIRDQALMAKMKESLSTSSSAKVSPQNHQPTMSKHSAMSTGSSSSSNNLSAADLLRKVQLSTDALANATDSLRIAAHNAIKSEEN